LAEKEERVKKLFLNQEINKAGCYAVKMFVNGEPTVIVVDDYFPYNLITKDWAFSK
jgi:hypothetical protein